ncbi:MAG TPA: nuclear transport factor 2 family protein [Bacteroidia bacterium]|jgi:hypothetical protein|nr:nuclear transport factor 2 family protein [Bacteroidia bacterium]HQF28135.1 nuclear transport factor 2 family protein [Bacteroidia bacterium]HQK97527.1 nuclear transport factor 2 family protein [Bacteroidia bacterium]
MKDLRTLFIAIGLVISANAFSQDTLAITNLVNGWHHAAAVADEDIFFGSMSDDAVYLGTDESERWVKNDFMQWSKKYFDRDSAWDFKPISRKIQFSDDLKTAWWDEKLDTWMGVCAGAGVATLTKNGWKIRHYQLAMMIPNDKVKSVLEVLKKETSKPEHKE